MYRRLWTAALFLFTAATAYGAEEVSSAVNTPFLKSWLAQQTATGNWNGLRNRLDSQGITISSNYTADIGGNPSGGSEQAAKYSGFLSIAAALDFEKIASLKGLALTFSNYLASGGDLSDKVDNFFGVQEIYAPGSYYFGELDLSWSLLDDKLVLEAGRLFAGDVFATSELWQYYLSGGINDNLNSIPANIFFPAFNIAAWAVRVTCQPSQEWQFVTGIYNADSRVEDTDKHGLDFRLDTDSGYLTLGQLTYKHHQQQDEDGLPGSITLGGYYQSSSFQDLTDPTKRWHGNYGFYCIADQMIYRGDWPEFQGPQHMSFNADYAERVKQPYHPRTAVPADRPKGLTAWAGLYFAPRRHINTQRYQVAAGLVYQGLPPNRDRDVTAFGVIVGHFSDVLAGQGTETVLELNHRFQVCQWFYVTPDIQYVINPNGHTDTPNALVLGLELSVNF